MGCIYDVRLGKEVCYWFGGIRLNGQDTDTISICKGQSIEITGKLETDRGEMAVYPVPNTAVFAHVAGQAWTWSTTNSKGEFKIVISDIPDWMFDGDRYAIMLGAVREDQYLEYIQAGTVILRRPSDPLCLPPKSPPCGSYGDLDGDGMISGNDISIVMNLVVSNKYDPRADVDGDGKVTLNDAQLIYNYLKGEINTFPVCQVERPNIFVLDIDVDKLKANVGDIITVTATVVNIGNAAGSEWFDVYVNGTAIGQPKKVTLNPNESTNVSWSLQMNEAGDYKICVDTILYF